MSRCLLMGFYILILVQIGCGRNNYQFTDANQSTTQLPLQDPVIDPDDLLDQVTSVSSGGVVGTSGNMFVESTAGVVMADTVESNSPSLLMSHTGIWSVLYGYLFN